ncbi:hypothetical protein AGLY_007371 [Aphis glycines]|uniref:Uncharacterized protein n=1 Tax=Aphis glycines TaxID=307491 RepID=A0A6G0TQQ6_APHGL|nr:hypothetical protein AGLY_007371 [Aphis glycines]
MSDKQLRLCSFFTDNVTQKAEIVKSSRMRIQCPVNRHKFKQNILSSIDTTFTCRTLLIYCSLEVEPLKTLFQHFQHPNWVGSLSLSSELRSNEESSISTNYTKNSFKVFPCGAGTDFPILITARYHQNQISGDRIVSIRTLILAVALVYKPTSMQNYMQKRFTVKTDNFAIWEITFSVESLGEQIDLYAKCSFGHRFTGKIDNFITGEIMVVGTSTIGPFLNCRTLKYQNLEFHSDRSKIQNPKNTLLPPNYREKRLLRSRHKTPNLITDLQTTQFPSFRNIVQKLIIFKNTPRGGVFKDPRLRECVLEEPKPKRLVKQWSP